MKQVFASRTVWLNLITSLIGILMLAAQMPQLEAYAPWIVLVVGALNVILRIWFTTTPLTFTPPAELEAKQAAAIEQVLARTERRAADGPLGRGRA